MPTTTDRDARRLQRARRDLQRADEAAARDPREESQDRFERAWCWVMDLEADLAEERPRAMLRL
jgi:hypothetical protein